MRFCRLIGASGRGRRTGRRADRSNGAGGHESGRSGGTGPQPAAHTVDLPVNLKGEPQTRGRTPGPSTSSKTRWTETGRKSSRYGPRIAEVGQNPLNYNFLAACRRPSPSAATSRADRSGRAHWPPASFCPLLSTLVPLQGRPPLSAKVPRTLVRRPQRTLEASRPRYLRQIGERRTPGFHAATPCPINQHQPARMKCPS
jgi:hypothetical protein